MKQWTSVFWYIVISALAFGGLVSWLAPQVIAWYFDPPVNIGLNCRAATEWSMKKLQTAQAVGLVSGGVFGLVFWLTLRAKQRRKVEAPVPPTEPENL